MPMKICPLCKKQCGPRTKQCECGHIFSTVTAAVAAVASPMTIDFTNEIKGTLESAKNILQRAGSRRSLSIPEPWEINSKSSVDDIDNNIDDIDESDESVLDKIKPSHLNLRRSGCRRTYVPSGDCPVKPAGYKAGWPNGPASDLVIQNWAVRVYNLCTDLQPHAVVYWARYYWDMNDVSVDASGKNVYGQEWRRIRGLILSAITGESSHESVDETD